MLLTSGQISMTISSCVVFLFTSLLFLSGYVLQQQTVRSIQAAIKPPPPPPLPSPDKRREVAKSFGASSSHLYFDKFLAANRPKGGWGKVAYAQLVRDHLHVCNAVMLFAELDRQESLARRLILYPKEWHISKSNQGGNSVHTETSLRLLKNAERRYKVELQPVSRMEETQNDAEAYPLAALLSLNSFNRLIYLQPSGLIINSGKLDSLFTLAMESETKGISANIPEQNATSPVLVFAPSAQAFNKTLSLIQARNYSEDEFLRSIPSLSATASNRSYSVVETSAIHQESDRFNLSSFIDTTSYVHISDPGMLGPEFGESKSRLIRARPEQMTQREVWEAVYERYRQQRMEVCGLDLEPDPELMGEKLVQGRTKKLRIGEDQKTLRTQDEAG